MISRGLLSEVLGYSTATNGYIKDNTIYWGMIGRRGIDDCEEYKEDIGIREFAHKCEEWTSMQEEYPECVEPEEIFKNCELIFKRKGAYNFDKPEGNNPL